MGMGRLFTKSVERVTTSVYCFWSMSHSLPVWNFNEGFIQNLFLTYKLIAHLGAYG